MTLIELLATLAVIAIVVSLAVPYLGGLRRHSEAAALMNSLTYALHMARSAAVSHNAAATVCQSDDGVHCTGRNQWHAGWLVFLDPNADGYCEDMDDDDDCDADAGLIVLRRQPQAQHFSLQANGNPASGRVTYAATGYAVGQQSTFRLCDGRGLVAPSGLVLNAIGRTRTADRAQLTCDD